MSIINLEKTFENKQLLYCNLDNKIIECVCLSELFTYDTSNNKDFETIVCDKVKVITIYDIYKKITYEPIQTNLFKDLIKIGGILENLIGRIYFFKTFMGAFIKNNKLNSIEYYTDDIGTLYKFLYNNIKLRVKNSIKTFNIYDNKGRCMYKFEYNKYFIIYIDYNDLFEYHICDNNIKITNGKFPFYQIIHYSTKYLKISKIEKYYKNIEDLYEERNDNNEITYLNEYNKNVLEEEFRFNDTNPPFSKPLKKDCIELINYYKKNINNYNELIKSCLKKEKIVHNNLLLDCNFEIINSK